MKVKLRRLRRHWPLLLLLILPVGIAVSSARIAIQTQQKRAEFERYLYRALDSCRNGNLSGTYGLLMRARSYAPSPADDDLARELIPQFRAGHCDLPGGPPSGTAGGAQPGAAVDIDVP